MQSQNKTKQSKIIQFGFPEVPKTMLRMSLPNKVDEKRI